ncbi:MAG: hypothetical protein R3B84_00480 [Zavarzinella sp.]
MPERDPNEQHHDDLHEDATHEDAIPEGMIPAAEPVEDDLNDEPFIDFGQVANIHEGASGVIPLDEFPESLDSQSMTSWSEIIRRERATLNQEELDAMRQEPSDPSFSPDSVDDEGPTRPAPSMEEVFPAEQIEPPSESFSYADLPTFEHLTLDVPLDSHLDEDDDRMGTMPQIIKPVTPDSIFNDQGKMPTSSDSQADYDLEAYLPDITPESDTGGSAVRFDSRRPLDEHDPEELDLGGVEQSFEPDNTGTKSSIIDVLLNSSPDMSAHQSGPSSNVLDFGHSVGANNGSSSHSRPPSVEDTLFPVGIPDNLPDMPPSSSDFEMESRSMEPISSDDAVDILAEARQVSSITDSGSFQIPKEVIDEAARKAMIVESSSVDLTSRSSLNESHFDMGLDGGAQPPESVIDLAIPESENTGGTSLIYRQPVSDHDLGSDLHAHRARPAQSDRHTSTKVHRTNSNKKGILIGTMLGLLLGAGGFAAVYLNGFIPNQDRTDDTVLAERAKELQDLRLQLDQAKKSTGPNQLEAPVKKLLAAAGIKDTADLPAALAQLQQQQVDAQTAAGKLRNDLMAAQMQLLAAMTELNDAQQVAKKSMMEQMKLATDLTSARTQVETLEKSLMVAQKDAETKLAIFNNAVKTAGLDPTKAEQLPKFLADAKMAADNAAKIEKDLTAKLTETQTALEKAMTVEKDLNTKLTAAKTVADSAMKVEKDLMAKLLASTADLTAMNRDLDAAKKLSADAKKQLEESEKTRKTTEATLVAVADRLEKAKFLTKKDDTTALIKAIDDAIKNTGGDEAMRAELVKNRDSLTSLQKEIATLSANEGKLKESLLTAAKTAMEAQKQAMDAKTAADTLKKSLEQTMVKLAEAEKSRKDDQDTYLKQLQVAEKLAKQQLEELQVMKTASDKLTIQLAESTAETARLKNALVLAKSNEPGAILKQLNDELSKVDPEKEKATYIQILQQRAYLACRSDTALAAKDGQDLIALGAEAEGNLILGMVAETTGKLDDADRFYREVLKKVSAGDLARRAMLGRANILRRKLSPPEPTSAPTIGGVSSNKIPLEALTTFLVVLLDPTATDPQFAEALKLADELIARKEYLGHLIKAELLSKLGKPAEALAEYSLGMKKLQVEPKGYEGILERILRDNPELASSGTTSSLPGGSPTRALRAYGTGLQLYFDDKFDAAEAQFKVAAENMPDARFYYYLGLTNLKKGSRTTALTWFRKAQELEAEGKPNYRTISQSLERIQGNLRMELNQFRP